MDEPFGALDAQTRDEMRLLLMDLWRELGTTIVFVTHDIEEAIFLGQRLVISTPRPFHLQREFEISFSYPRPHEQKMTPEFIELENEVTIALRQLIRLGGGT